MGEFFADIDPVIGRVIYTGATLVGLSDSHDEIPTSWIWVPDA